MVCVAEKLYWCDAYMRSFSARVTQIEGEGAGGKLVIALDRTAFYPTGGGQPNDIGKLVSSGKTIKVVDVIKQGDAILHAVDSVEGLKAGDTVEGEIDWERRYAHMRHHTALHIIDGVVQKKYGGKITGGQIYADRARMDFDVPGMDRGMMEEIIDGAQRIADQGRKVTAKFISKEEASSIPDLARTSPGAELLSGLDEVRVVEIEGFDIQLDGGLHVASTKEIGRILLSAYKSNGTHSKRVYVALQL